MSKPIPCWLVHPPARKILTRATPDLMESIGAEIFSKLPSHHAVSPNTALNTHSATFEIDWDPLLFCRQQGYVESADKAIRKAITITGSVDDAQATTMTMYILQTWPKMCIAVMQLVGDVLRREEHEARDSLWDGTTIHARIHNKKFFVTTTGTADVLVELGQQFTWLGAALRSSPFDAGVAHCVPKVRAFGATDSAFPQAHLESTPEVDVFCSITYEIQEPFPGDSRLSGQCWHSMFRNSVMVAGFPIRAKGEPSLGLEMPLPVIAALTGSDRLSQFNGKIFIKGFSTLAVATKKTGDLIVWHYLYNAERERISYLDHNTPAVDDISLLQLDSARHVIGWCSDCKHYAGTQDARYDVAGTALPHPHASCILDRVTLSVGKIMTGGLAFAIGVRQNPSHLIRESYLDKLRWIEKKYVVMWDEEGKRGWLVNGTSALLHLARASLKGYSEDSSSAAFMLDPSKIRDAKLHGADSAARILSDARNRNLEIHPDKMERSDEVNQSRVGVAMSRSQTTKEAHFLFESLVEKHYHVLEQMMDYQRHAAGGNGVKLKSRSRKYLEGWDFANLVTDLDFHPRVATLHAMGYSWVDFIRYIDAITLLGRGFGDLILPVETRSMCSMWKTLPTQRYYLASTTTDLKEIIKQFQNGRTEETHLVPGLLWHCPTNGTTSCQCKERTVREEIRGANGDHHDPVQVILPLACSDLLQTCTPSKMEGNGAVVFGHNVTWKYRWPERGEDLEEGETTLLFAEHDDVAYPTANRSEALTQEPPSIGPRSPSTPESPDGMIDLSTLSETFDGHDAARTQVGNAEMKHEAIGPETNLKGGRDV